ncbi:uncharacterized protein LOC130549142 isoform X2 [Triplophysa rosa]|uniref:uncharacterized protein LOC130549142 isoform X2 n=1 Tax=Triplophysa rosa TaxID=992332 RepID=UPI0025460584|nr:uncharacterized protein LOC130549142 isoform X2 [Triplophysa rosa]
MKNTFTRNVLFVVFYHLFHLCGVFGADADEVKSVMEGDSVTLHTHLTHIQSYSLTLWRFGDEGVTIVRINRDKIIYSDIPAFRDRMVLDDQTGSLTITNSRPKHSGLYKIEINNSTGTSLKKFRLTVYNSPLLIEAEKGELKTVSVTEGDPASLMMEVVEIQRYDLIVWRFGDDGILIVKGDREDNKTTFSHDETYGDRLELNYQTGSLTITDARITDAGLYKAKISGDRRAEYMRIILTVSASGVSSGGVAGIVIVVLMALSGAVGVFVFFYRRRTSEIKKQNDVFVDKSVLIKPEDSVILDTGVKEIQKDDEITWMYEGASIAKIKQNQTVENMDARFRGKLKLNPQNGSLTIKDTKTELAGLYKVKMRLQDLPSAQIINVSASDKLSVNEGDSFTLSSGHTELRDSVMTWRLGDKHIATVNGSQASVCVEERFRYRVHVDPQTGSLTVRNSRTEDSGLYQLQIGGREKSERKFTVRVCEKIKEVSVMEGDSFTLHTGDVFTQKPDMIKWEFKYSSIAELIGIKPVVSAVDKDDRFRGRLELDHQTGSLALTNSRTTDSGLYTLRITRGVTEDSEWKFSVTVRSWAPWEKRPELREGKMKTVSVDEGDSLTLSTGDAFIQSPDMIKWMFENICIAEFTGIQRPAADVDKDDRFSGRLELDYKDASLNITNITSKDSGLYRLRTITGDSERKFNVTVRGVFGADADEVKSVMDGDSVTLHTHLTHIQSYSLTLWRFGDEGVTIARINRDKIIYSDIPAFRDRMVLDDQTGSLTITNSRPKHSGLYKIEFNNSTGTSLKKFRLTVYNSPLLIEAEKGELKTVSVTEGDPASLMMEVVEIQRYDLIVWRFGDDGILIVKGDREDNKTTFSHDETYGDRLELNYQTGSLTITDARITDAGLYKAKISGDRRAEYMRIILTVSASGVSSGGVAGIVIVVLMALSGAVGVFVFFYRRRTSEIKKQNDVFVDKSVLIKPEDSVILDTGVKEIHEKDEITWMYEGASIAKMRGDQTVENMDARFRGKLKLNPQNGSLTIKDTKTELAGLYKVKMRLQDLPSAQIINVSASDKLSVNEGDSFTLSSGHTELRDSVMTWRLGDKHIATVNGSQASVCVEERFKDRVHVDPQTGSLTVRNSRTEDSGLYQLQIGGREKSERKFTVRVREKIKKVSANEAASLTLHTEVAFTRRPDMIKWMFGDICIAGYVGKSPAHDVNNDRFKNRLEMDPATGSLTIANTKTTDSGRYTLMISPDLTGDSQRKFFVTVRGRPLWKKCPQLREETTVNAQDESEPEVTPDSLSSEQTDKLSVKKGDSFTLSSGHTELSDSVMTWRLGDKHIATVNGSQASVFDEERFKDRVHVDPQTGSLTVRNSRTEDSGLYRLQIGGGDYSTEKSERKIIVNVCEKMNTVAVMEGDSFTLHIEDIQRADTIKWMFKKFKKTTCIAENVGNTPAAALDVDKDDRFRGRLELDRKTGSLTITDTRKTDSGRYTLMINPPINGNSEWKFSVTLNDKLSVKKGDSFTLSSGHTELRDSVMTWRLGDKHIATINGSQASVFDEERFKDRVHVDPQTGSLTVRNSRTEDSGLYRLQIGGGDYSTEKSERKIIVNVCEKMNTVAVMEGDSFTLHIEDIQRADTIKWMFKKFKKTTCIAENVGNTPAAALDVDKDDRFRGRLELDRKTGSLTITDTRKTDSGRYTLMINPPINGNSEWKFSVTLNDKLSVKKGDSFTLSSGHTELRDSVMTWRLGDKHIATVNGSQASVCVEERFKDRVHVDPQTGSLTVRNSRTEDSGLYQLQISAREKSERKFTVTVRDRRILRKKNPKPRKAPSTENQGNDSDSTHTEDPSDRDALLVKKAADVPNDQEDI